MYDFEVEKLGKTSYTYTIIFDLKAIDCVRYSAADNAFIMFRQNLVALRCQLTAKLQRYVTKCRLLLIFDYYRISYKNFATVYVKPPGYAIVKLLWITLIDSGGPIPVQSLVFSISSCKCGMSAWLL